MGCAKEAGCPGADCGRGRVRGALRAARGRHRARGYAPPACVLGTWSPRAGVPMLRARRAPSVPVRRCCSARRRLLMMTNSGG